MPTLQHRQEKIQVKRMRTPWKDFVLEVCSRFPFFPNKEHGVVSRYPKTGRIGGLADSETYCGYTPNTEEDFNKAFGTMIQKTFFCPMLHRGDNERVEYADIVLNAKNAYLSNAVVDDSHNILYSRSVKHACTDTISSVMIRNGGTQIYQSSGVINSSSIFFSSSIQDSSNIWFSRDLINCHNCLLCNNLQNQSYCIKNISYTKEEYALEKEKILRDKNKYIKYHEQVKNLAPTQENLCIFRSQNISNGYFVNDVRHGRNLVLFGSNTDCTHIYDCITGGSPHADHIYGGLSCSGEHIYCGGHCENCFNVYYSFDIEGCSHCLGCIGLKNKSFCIFNKQYTKEERYEKVDEIFTQMEQNGILGKFFPGSMSPFYFNDTAAYLIDDSFTKEEVEAKGYLRRDEKINVDIPEGLEVVKTNELDTHEGWKDEERYIDPAILKKVIQDEEGNVYRIVQMEYDFLMKHGLPLPRKHWLARLKSNFRIT